MKYVRTFESFKNDKNEPLNEEFLGAIGKWLGNMFKKAQENIRKTGGGKDVEVIYQKYLKKITDEFKKQVGVDLNLAAVVKESLKINESGVDETEVEDKPGETKDKNSKMTSKTLKEKSKLMDKIVLNMKAMALKEMDGVLKNKGGASKNPKLKTIIDIKKSQFGLDFMNAKIKFLEQSGDKSLIGEITKQRDDVAKTIAVEWKTFDKNTDKVEYSVGDVVVYKRKKFSDDVWNKLTDDDKKKPEVLKQTGIVGIKPITSIDGDKVEFKSNDDKSINKTIGDILFKFKSKKEEGKEEGK